MSPNTFTHGTSGGADDPDSNFDDHAQTLGAIVIYFMLMCLIMLILVCFVNDTANLLDGLKSLYIPMATALVGMWWTVLFSLTIELDLSHMSLWLQRLLHLANITFFITAVFFLPSLEAWQLNKAGSFSFLLCATGVYILGVVCYRIHGTF